MAFELPQLPYANDALEPHIDARTMEIHHGKHHFGYTTKLNLEIEGSGMESDPIESILTNMDMSNGALRNNGGGYYNHCLFWEVMGPNSTRAPSGPLANAIDAAYGSFEEFRNAFSNTAATQFGSGWAWLCLLDDGKLEVCSSANQDNPLMPGIGCGGTPILGLDVWEHAYYLNYQNLRADYVTAFFNVVNWAEVSKRYSDTL